MPEISYKDVVKTLEAEVGYQGQHYNSKYTQFLDSINWYNYKKAGACTWCCILCDYAIAVNKGSLTYEQARQVACEPANHNYNVGAGVKEKAQLFKEAKRWISKAKDATTGDQIFLNGLKHVGTVVGWDSTGLFYIDGSTTYEGKPYSVGKKHIPFNSSKIDGFGRPNWYKFQDSNPTPAPQPTPEPPKPTTQKYKVKTNTGAPLALRTAPKTSSVCIVWMPNKSEVTVSEFVSGQEVGGCSTWAKATYKGMTGYCLSKYLVKA